MEISELREVVGLPDVQTCQCILRRINDPNDRCERAPDPASGEALLCSECMDSPSHREANNQPKRLPKRSIGA